MRKKVINILGLIGFVGLIFLCACVPDAQTPVQKEAGEMNGNLIYVRDNRTGLCFTKHYGSHTEIGYCHVPCTKEVLAHLSNK